MAVQGKPPRSASPGRGAPRADCLGPNIPAGGKPASAGFQLPFGQRRQRQGRKDAASEENEPPSRLEPAAAAAFLNDDMKRGEKDPCHREPSQNHQRRQDAWRREAELRERQDHVFRPQVLQARDDRDLAEAEDGPKARAQGGANRATGTRIR